MTARTPGTRKTINALADWIIHTRQQAPLLDDYADALLNQLALSSHQLERLDTLEQHPRTLGLYGHNQAGKASIISLLTGTDPGHIAVAPAGKHFNYLAHINPAHASTRMAIRFSSYPARTHQDWPLTLRLFSEIELVQLLIQHHLHQQPNWRLEETLLQHRIQQFSSLCQPQQTTAVSQTDIAALAETWRYLTRQTLQPTTWQQLIQLLPQLSLNERSELYALFWGEQRELTHQWLQLVQTLQTLSYAGNIAVPLSLITDNFSLPAEGLLYGDLPEQHILVSPLHQGELLPAVSVDLTTLTILAVELILPLATSCILPGVDLLDIPGEPLRHSLQHSKIAFLLDYYRQQQQPDVLLICNATDNIRNTTSIASRLLHWQQHTHPVSNPPRPALVWTITPDDLRFKEGVNPDESIQRLLGRPGELWGTLQALEDRNLQRMTEWLAQAINDKQRQERSKTLKIHQKIRLQQHFMPLTTAAKPADQQALAQQAIRELQHQAIQHGDLLQALLPDTSLLQNLCKAEPYQASANKAALFLPDIDLLADDETSSYPATSTPNHHSGRVYRYWINHIRQWTQQPQHAQQLALSPEILRWLGDTLIITSYRLKLDSALQQTSLHNEQPGAQLQAQMNNFLSWLGYADVPLSERPLSRINKGAAIFQPQPPRNLRLTRLSDQPVHAATLYVYDWLIALYTRAQENIGYHHPCDLKATDRASLKKLLNKLSPEES